MKLTILQNGNIIIEFQKSEIQEIAECKQLELISIEKEDDPFKFLRNKTKDFIKDVYKKYGNKEFNVKDNFITEMRRKHFITDFDKSLKTLKNRNMCNINYADGNQRRRMTTIKFNF